jgi:hypothetical protein
MEILALFNFRINYIKGIENGGADTLSRRLDYKEETKPSAASILKRTRNILIYRPPLAEILIIIDI